MTDFGWHYPAGAANDPNAPYNQDDIGPCVCGHPWEDHEDDTQGPEPCLVKDCECEAFEEAEPEDEEEDRWGDD